MGISLPIAEAPRPRVLLSEPMLRYRCNQKGCCCRGWDIPFKLDDFIRLYDHLPEEERADLGAGLKLLVDEAPDGATEDLLLKSLKLAGVGEDQRCRFCTSEGGCTVHAKHGISALPDICVSFPAHGFRDQASGEVELYWDPVCPEVVRLFADEGGAVSLAAVEPPNASGGGGVTRDLSLVDSPRDNGSPLEMGWRDPGFAQRVANATEPLLALLDGAPLSRDELMLLRGRSMAGLSNLSRPTWELLASLLNGYRSLERGRVEEFAARLPEDIDAFQGYLGGCIGAHSGPLLFWSLRKMERFVHAIDLKPLISNPRALLAALDAWGDALDRRYSDAEELALRPLFSRYLQHRFGMLYVNQGGELREAADTIALIFGASLRFSGAIADALDRPVDSAIAQAGIAAGEYVYRTLQFSAEDLPWFASAAGRAIRAAAKTGLMKANS